MRRSYNSYLKYRQAWKQKGYGIQEKMTIEEYTQWHVLESLKGGDPNIARTIARQSLSYTASAAKEVAKIARGIDKEGLKQKAKKPKKKKKLEYDIYDIRSTLKATAELDNEERDEERMALREKYYNWRDIAAVEDREQVFLDLAAAEIDLDMWDLPDAVRDDLYHDELKRFRERFEADLYGTK